jgi:hypothetical protein
MKGKIIIIVIGLVGSFILQTFTKATWIFPLVVFIIFAYLFIKIVIKILKRDKGGSGDDENGGYFDIFNA